jgi:hypothetical protein
MTRRKKTDGERISAWVLEDALDNQFSSVVRPAGGRNKINLDERIDRLIRKRMGEAWDEGWVGRASQVSTFENPHRGRRKK